MATYPAAPYPWYMVALVDIQVKKEYGPKYPVLMSDLVSVPGTYICIESLFRWNFYFFHPLSACLDKPLYSCSSVSSLDPLFPGKGEWRNNSPAYIHVTLFQLYAVRDAITVRARSKWNQALSPLRGMDSSTRNVSTLKILTWGTKAFKMLANHHQWKVQSKASPTICSLPAFQ